MSTTTTNDDLGCYVFKYGDHTTTRGYESLLVETQALADRLNRSDLRPSDDEIGHLSVVARHHELLRMAAKRELGTWFDPRTPKKVCRVLEQARKNGTLLRLFYGEPETGRDWLEEHDVLGTIGRSTGVLKVPLLIGEGGHSGPAVLDHCIVRIIRVEDGKVLYQHPRYHLGELTVTHAADQETPAEVNVDGRLAARFRDPVDAYHWMAFMAGRSFLPMEG